MTDKQIIIDGIDVGGCIYYEDGKCLNGEMVQCNCKKVAVCYYKEYKRKEQECEELKKGYSELTDIVSPYMDDFTGYNEELGGFDIVLCVKELMEQLDQLKAENDTLTEQLAEMVSQSALLPKFFGLSAEEIKQLVTKCNQLYKTLTEIKTDILDIKEGISYFWVIDKCDEILQKISECEVE